MKFEILTVGKPRKKFVKQGIAHYLNHLSTLAPTGLEAVKPAVLNKSTSPAQARSVEAEAILARIKSNFLVVALDLRGKSFSSPAMAEQLAAWDRSGKNKVVFVIGGPHGLDQTVLDRADLVVKLSTMTLSHELCLLFCLEQLYRALSLRANRPYAK